MYKVFYKERCIFLYSAADLANAAANRSVIHYDTKSFASTISSFIADRSASELHICNNQPTEIMLKALEELFPPVIAGGGIVLNLKRQLLVILRQGKWDLPKGKTHRSERLPDAALREVAEETGATDLVIVRKIGITRHIFFAGTDGFIKESHWFLMHASGNLPLKPQTAENILEAKWIDIHDVPFLFENTWPSVRNLLNDFILQYKHSAK